MYHVSAQDVDERMLNVQYYYSVAKDSLDGGDSDQLIPFSDLCLA